MDFFHCMRCSHWPMFQPENRLRYFLSSCGRLYCENCVNALGSKCTCGAEHCKMQEIKSQSGKEIKSFFMDQVSVLQEAMKKPVQIIQFQNTLQKNCLRNVGKLVEGLKTLRNENNSLKLENNHLRMNSESLKQQVEQLKSKVTELTQQFNNSSFLSNTHSMNESQHQQASRNHLNLNTSNENLNLFGSLNTQPQRPNAQVQPTVHHEQRSIPPTPVELPFRVNRTPPFQSVGFVAPSISPSPSGISNQPQHQLFSNSSGLSQNFSQVRVSPSPTNHSPGSFGTPASSISQFSTGGGGGIQRSPFQRLSSNTPGRNQSTPTPEIINRLRNLKCRMTPNSASRSGSNYPPCL